MKKKKRKLNWVAVGNLVGLIASSLVILGTVFEVIIEPFFTKEMIMLTPFGLGILLVAFMICNSCFTYFEERL